MASVVAGGLFNAVALFNVGPEPTLNDYYEPSDDMKMYTNVVVVGVTGSVAGVLASKMLL